MNFCLFKFRVDSGHVIRGCWSWFVRLFCLFRCLFVSFFLYGIINVMEIIESVRVKGQKQKKEGEEKETEEKEN